MHNKYLEISSCQKLSFEVRASLLENASPKVEKPMKVSNSDIT